MKKIFFAALIVMLQVTMVFASSDWPVYKGNIYYTGNNDEITVKNNNLKWLFQASEMVYNPIVSDGRVFFIDIKKNVYCLDEDTGKLVWKLDLPSVSAQFASFSKAMGKVKYPLIKGNRLYLTDSIAVYCMDKNTGRVLWARTGLKDEKDIFKRTSWSDQGSSRGTPVTSRNWRPQSNAGEMVDGIYSDPMISGDLIYYGTRNVFLSRDINDGHLRWNNSEIKSYSGFPSFYDNLIFTQSMDYAKNTFSLYCMESGNGAVKWVKPLDKPHRIFSPVVYSGKVYLASGKSLYCYDLKTGEKAWEKSYADLVTSNPSFTEREILFTVGNRMLVRVNPSDGGEIARIDIGDQSSPYFVIIRDQFYVASTFKKSVGGRDVSYSSMKAVRFDTSGRLWEFVPPFPGGASQPVASNGIMFLPAGNYLYAIGTDYYPRIIKGGSGYYDPYDKGGDEKKATDDRKGAGDKTSVKDDRDSIAPDKKPVEKPAEKPDELKTRKMKITVGDKTGSPVPAEVDVRKWDRGKLVYSRKTRVANPGQEIEVPDADDVEITGSSSGYLPKKIIIGKKDSDRTINLDKIEKGGTIVVENIYFEINEAYLKKESLNILDRIIQAIKENARVKIEVRGHTDSTGTRDHNQKLSVKRADAVVDYMIKNGISPERLRSKGFGQDKPIADNGSEAGRKKNRRTEFQVLDM
ncbi:MAG: PQQ-binding-like beta-propeller repeat protein [Spirochaetes bacterium]|jgi:outer membrane protein OmpA-like peptidoglycan-associated protein/outer membrane protein assembly factor BamB|nr:PQQ-binding-like beta-propeller repeat protein [Spirochaetota bacterium]